MPQPMRPGFRAIRLAIAGLLAVGGVFAISMTALAYPPGQGTSGVTASCSSTGENSSCGVTFHLADTQGNGIAGASVNFSVSGCGSVNPTSAVTNSSGDANTTFFAGSCCGTATITGSSQGVTEQTQVTVKCPSSNGGAGLPFTGTSPPNDHTGAFAALAIAAGLALAGTVVFGASRRRTA